MRKSMAFYVPVCIQVFFLGGGRAAILRHGLSIVNVEHIIRS